MMRIIYVLICLFIYEFVSMFVLTLIESVNDSLNWTIWLLNFVPILRGWAVYRILTLRSLSFSIEKFSCVSVLLKSFTIEYLSNIIKHKSIKCIKYIASPNILHSVSVLGYIETNPKNKTLRPGGQRRENTTRWVSLGFSIKGREAERLRNFNLFDRCSEVSVMSIAIYIFPMLCHAFSGKV